MIDTFYEGYLLDKDVVINHVTHHVRAEVVGSIRGEHFMCKLTLKYLDVDEWKVLMRLHRGFGRSKYRPKSLDDLQNMLWEL